ncbi:metallophosphoesterase [Glycomyces xiaoerkulensis]|uniref:metallophosphoesterase n=1 Tax=Glycomyces xiaoerkulensis TaxID=2038139 RepID=UPI0018E487E8|nr:metallophosphoesterase [Glycomyces xiaoerkulensis]
MSDASPLFVASDVHGHRDALAEALRGRGLVDGEDAWCGGGARLWVLGDLFDRGPQGVPALRLVRRLADQAAAEGGLVDTLIGNHEVLMLGSRRFGGEPFTDADGHERQFLHWWVLNGGFEDDMGELTDEEADWLRSRRIVHLAGKSLLVHSDTEGYLDYGDTEESVNSAAREVLASGEPERWWRLFRDLTRRHEFMGEAGPARVRGMLRAYGGEELVHGHSTIPDTTGLEPGRVTEARRYCDGLVLNVDGGVYQGGKCLVARLDLSAVPLVRQRVSRPGRRGSGMPVRPRLQPQAQRGGRADADHHPPGERRERDQDAGPGPGGGHGDRAHGGREERVPHPTASVNSIVSHIRHNDPPP